MDCKKIKNRLFFLAEGSLKKDEEIEVRNHLEHCPECMKQYEFFSGFENIIREEKNSSPDDYLYSRLVNRMEQITTLPETPKLHPALIRLANVFIITIIIGIALFSGITIAERNYQYLGSSQDNQQLSNQQNDIAVDQDQLSSNFPEY